jgi:translocation protein SEC63
MLGLKFHPDKAEIDETKNITTDFINERWVEMTKAFKALTDEEVRNNYLQYGHPDGKQSFSIGIALPNWLVTEGHGKYVLIVYGALLGIILPYIVGKWWYGQQKFTRDGILVSSAGKLFREYDNEITEGGIVGAVSTGDEYRNLLKGNKAEEGIAKLETRILKNQSQDAAIAGFNSKEKKKLDGLEESTQRKVLGLLWAYLGRVELEDPSLDSGLLYTIPLQGTALLI